MTALETLDAGVLVPDGIEPVVAERCWNIDPVGTLVSLNGERWKPGEPLEAACRSVVRKAWSVIRGGMDHAQAKYVYHRAASVFDPWGHVALVPTPPSLSLPDGYGFELVEEHHDAPDEGCSCGIYAATNIAATGYAGVVYGTVKMWGKVVPGEKGFRAQYAYPAEFRVAARLDDHPTLRAFGVPIVVDHTLDAQSVGLSTPWFTPRRPTPNPRRVRLMYAAVGMNLAACAFNLAGGLEVF